MDGTMARAGRLALFAAFVAVVGAASWLQFATQRTRADRASATAGTVAAVYDSLVQGENAARDYTTARDPSSLERYRTARAQLEQSIGEAEGVLADSPLRAAFDAERTLVDAWGASVTRDVEAAIAGGTPDGEQQRTAARGSAVTQIRAANDALLQDLARRDRDARDTSGRWSIAVILSCCVLFTATNWILFVRTERRQERERDRQLAFADRLQGARTEDAGRALLARHIEQIVPDSMALVTEPDDRSAAGRPVVWAGERVATVIIRTPRELAPHHERLVHDSVVRAAPVLATLRSLALAQVRAATDPLTGLGNRRLVEDALARIAAQSVRTGEQFAIAVVDLDRFKAVNDTHGHTVGDALLVAIAVALDQSTREYDIVGRHGGDEFIVLLAGLDAPAAASVMERCRAAIAAVRVGPATAGVTASIGVAASVVGAPTDPTALVRAADDAPYAAKADGGNQVVVATPVAVGG
jgi:diguanylate cyclase (GGDEF)-like protein